MNNRPMKGYGNQTRAERFRMLDAPALSSLPLAAYEYTEYNAVKVGPDYHVEYARHWYSVPHELAGQRLSLKAGQTVVQIWHKGQYVAQHPRSSHEYKHTTNPLHMPVQHRGHGTGAPERLPEMGYSIGPFTGRVVDAMLKAKAHPELAYRAVLGLTALQKKYTAKSGWKKPVASPGAITCRTGASSTTCCVITGRIRCCRYPVRATARCNLTGA